jgi:hypothetical protein
LLAREFFAAGETKLHAPRDVPSVITETQRRRRSRLVRRFWKVAMAPTEPHVTRKKFRKLTKLLGELRQLQRDGLLRLEWREAGTP